MIFWLRELAGWGLVLTSLWVLSLGLDFLRDEKPIQASVVAFAALGVLRSGILLVRVSTAAKICLRELRLRQSDE